jgi:AraC family transcriptional regulator
VGAGFASVTKEEGVTITSADVNGFTLAELRFPSGYRQDAFEPDSSYLALVLDGAMEKSFRSRTLSFGQGNALTMPAGTRHSARFGSRGARIVIVKPRHSSGPAGHSFEELAVLRGSGFTWLAWKLAAELRASDEGAPLAAEGLALELLAATTRETSGLRLAGRPPAWLRSAEELLRANMGDCVGLGEVASAIGVHPAHLARVFRAHYGVSVGEYGRRLRLAWAATEIARGDTPLATVAAEAGFADQSHFTRLFRRHVGITPARYRAEAQRDKLGTFQTP